MSVPVHAINCTCHRFHVKRNAKTLFFVVLSMQSKKGAMRITQHFNKAELYARGTQAGKGFLPSLMKYSRICIDSYSFLHWTNISFIYKKYLNKNSAQSKSNSEGIPWVFYLWNEYMWYHCSPVRNGHGYK